MELKALDYNNIIPKRKGQVLLGNVWVQGERITGNHAKLMLESGQMSAADFARREPAWLIVERETQDVIAVFDTQPETINTKEQRGWASGEEFYSAQTYNLHPFKELGIPANLKEHALSNSPITMPEMVLNGNHTPALRPPSRPQPAATFPQAAPTKAAAPAEAAPSLFTMERPRFNEQHANQKPWGSFRRALANATDWASVYRTEGDYATSTQEPVYGDDFCKFTTPRLLNLLSNIQGPDSDEGYPVQIGHVLVLGVNDGQNLLALADHSSSSAAVIHKITAVQKPKAKGDKVRQRVFEQLAGGAGDEQDMLDLVTGRENYLRLVKSGFDKLDFKKEAGDAPFSLILFDLYEDTPAAIKTLFERAAQAAAETSVWIINHWNMPSVRQGIEQVIATQQLGCVHWKLELPGYMDEKGYDADLFGNGVCIFYLNRSQPS